MIEDLMRPEMRNLVSATLSTEQASAFGQKNVLESMVNRAVAYKRAGKYKGMENMIKGGFYGPYNRGQTNRVMARGLTDARSEQVKGFIEEIGAGRNVMRGMTDQGMINEIKGYKEKIGGEYYGFMAGLGEQYKTAAFTLSKEAAKAPKPPSDVPAMLAAAPDATSGAATRAAMAGGAAGVAPGAQLGGIVRRHSLMQVGERNRPEAIIPLTGGRRARGLLDYASKAMGMRGTAAGGHTVNFSPVITINGNASEEEQRAMDSKLRNLASDFIRQFKAAQTHERRLSFESGYG
jgi:hypothetical protein